MDKRELGYFEFLKELYDSASHGEKSFIENFMLCAEDFVEDDTDAEFSEKDSGEFYLDIEKFIKVDSLPKGVVISKIKFNIDKSVFKIGNRLDIKNDGIIESYVIEAVDKFVVIARHLKADYSVRIPIYTLLGLDYDVTALEDIEEPIILKVGETIAVLVDCKWINYEVISISKDFVTIQQITEDGERKFPIVKDFNWFKSVAFLHVV